MAQREAPRTLRVAPVLTHPAGPIYPAAMPLSNAERSARRRARIRGEPVGPTHRQAALADRLRLGVRRCGRCGEVKELASFGRGAEAADGRRSWCRACCAADTARRKAAARAAAAREAERDRRRRVASALASIRRITPSVRAPDFTEAGCRRYGEPSWWMPGADKAHREAAVNICISCPV